MSAAPAFFGASFGASFGAFTSLRATRQRRRHHSGTENGDEPKRESFARDAGDEIIFVTFGSPSRLSRSAPSSASSSDSSSSAAGLGSTGRQSFSRRGGTPTTVMVRSLTCGEYAVSLRMSLSSSSDMHVQSNVKSLVARTTTRSPDDTIGFAPMLGSLITVVPLTKTTPSLPGGRLTLRTLSPAPTTVMIWPGCSVVFVSFFARSSPDLSV